MTSSDAAGWIVLVPVKNMALAKTRMSSFAGEWRPQLALAMATDTVSAALQSPLVRRVLVVTNDPSAPSFIALGAQVVPDQPDAGLNPALVHAAHVARREHPATPIVAIAADLPALRPDELTAALQLRTADRWFVSDAAGVGTTLLATLGGSQLQPAFGRHSRAAHRESGALEVDDPGLASVRRDVDTEVDLWDADRLGLGRQTAQVLALITRGG